MKVRQLRKYAQGAMAYYLRLYADSMAQLNEFRAAMKAAGWTEEVADGRVVLTSPPNPEARNEIAEMVEDVLRAKKAENEAAAVSFTVKRKKDNEVVGTYGSRAEAEAVVEKAARQKKAALYIDEPLAVA